MSQEFFGYNATHFRHPLTSMTQVIKPPPGSLSSSYSVYCTAMNRSSLWPSSVAEQKSASPSLPPFLSSLGLEAFDVLSLLFPLSRTKYLGIFTQSYTQSSPCVTLRSSEESLCSYSPLGSDASP